MTNGFERRREQSKEEVRRAAWELFGRFGVERVSIADIARKAGVSQATIYNNFESKEALAREFEASVVDGLVDRIALILAPEMPFPEKIAAFMTFIADTLTHGHPSDADTTVFTSSADLEHDPQIKRIRDAARERMTSLLLLMVAEGREHGQANPNVSDHALRVYFRMFMDIFIDPQLRQRFSSPSALVEELGSLMMYGLTGPGEKS